MEANGAKAKKLRYFFFYIQAGDQPHKWQETLTSK